jgi:hypothetical protein
MNDEGELEQPLSDTELGPQGKRDKAQARIRTVKGGSIDAKKGMFEIDPAVKVEMVKKHKMKQMLRKVKRDKILNGIKGRD